VEQQQLWFVLIYKLPTEPSRYRAAIWRKLKAAGAIYLQSGVAALPADAGSERVMRALLQEIPDMSGAATLLRSTPVGEAAATSLVAAFNAARAEEYGELLSRCHDFHAELAKERAAGNLTFAELEENEEELTKLEGWLAKIRTRDRFSAALGAHAGQAVLACREDLDAFAKSVYETAAHKPDDESVVPSAPSASVTVTDSAAPARAAESQGDLRLLEGDA